MSKTKSKHMMAIVSFSCALVCLMVFILTSYTLAAISLFICLFLAVIYRNEYNHETIMEEIKKCQ